MLRTLLLPAIFLSLPLALASEPLPEREEVSPNLFPVFDYERLDTPEELPRQWRVKIGDHRTYARPDFDDHQWKQVNIGTPLPGRGWRWYRLTFTLPESLHGKDLLLNLGAISVHDQLFVNGTKVGEFGGRPPHFAQKASEVQRLYPVPSKYWQAGENTLALRVYSGVGGGMHRGPYTLQAYNAQRLYWQFKQKTPGKEALLSLLFDSPTPPAFAPGAPLVVEPQLTRLDGKAVQGRLIAELADANGKVIDQQSSDLLLRGMRWSGARFRWAAPANLGTYQCTLRFQVDGKELAKQTLPFEVKPSTRLTYELPVDPNLPPPPETFAAAISPVAVGRFGPREVDANARLTDSLDQLDSRSGLTYSFQFDPEAGAPRLFLANTRPIPKGGKRIRRFHRVAGHQYDGLGDAWVYGLIRPAGTSEMKAMEVAALSWARRTHRYTYQDGTTLDLTLSAISPAWLVTSTARQIALFADIETHGIGLPSRIAYPTANGIKVVPAADGIQGADLTANWILVWFNGSKGWDEFDTPYLIVLEKRPKQISLNHALQLDFPSASGVIQGMPLYGVTLQPLAYTETWSTALPDEVVERCQYWSQALVHAPVEVERTAHADFERDFLWIKDEFTHLDLRDDWGTPGRRLAPLSPTLALSAKAAKLDLVGTHPSRDLQLATLHGPYVALEDRTTSHVAVKGRLHWLLQRRQPPASLLETEPARTLRAELNRIVAQGLESELRHHPWPRGVQHQSFIPGRHRARYTHLLLALPYLDAPLRAAVAEAIREETETYFLRTTPPPPALAEQLLPAQRDLPLLVTVTNPITRLPLATAPYGLTRFGIDQPYFGAMNLYMCLSYAETFQRHDWLKAHYPTLLQLFNAVRNSHDWSIGVSWDSFSGLRVGNGHQESSGIHAAMVALLRTAPLLDDEPTRHQSAYYALMQLIGMQAQLYASDYLQQNRPWLASNSRREQIEFAQRIRGKTFAEFNEFSGLSQAIISSGNIASRPGNLSGSSPNGLVESPVPEVMRLYRELWPDFINDFFDPKYDLAIQRDRRLDPNISIDTFLYQIESYPQPISEIFELRRAEPFNWWVRLADYRAYLDSLHLPSSNPSPQPH